MKLGDSDTPVEHVCGPGADPTFDQLISALGHIARQKPKPLIDTIMFWRKAKGDGAITAKQMANQVSNDGLWPVLACLILTSQNHHRPRMVP